MASLMIVDDEATITTHLEGRLSLMGYNVLGCAYSGEEAITMAKRLIPDIILMDIVMPGKLNGIEASKIICNELDIPVIFLTAFLDDSYIDKAKSAEPYGYIVKPFREREVKAAIEIALSKKCSDNKIIESENRYRSIVESANDAIIIIDKTGNIITWNHGAENIFLYSSIKIIGKPISLILSEREIKNRIRKIIKTGNDEIILETEEYTGIKKDRKTFPAEITFTTWRIKTNIFLTMIIRDVSKRKKMENEIEKHQKLEALGTLAAGIAHDFNNILMGILGNVSLVKKKISIENENYKLLSRAEDATLRAKNLAQQLLTFAKGGAPIKKTAPIDKFVKGGIEFLLHGTNIRLVLSSQKNLSLVDFDRDQLNQVITNLTINAVQAMSEGGTFQVCLNNIKINKISDIHLKKGNFVRITFEDKGTGIERENLSKIFDPFFSTKQLGNGLGLAISYSIIKKHGGFITVESEPDVGTIFFIYLPASKKAVQNADREIDEDNRKIIQKIQEKHSKTGKILVMDDEELICEFMPGLLDVLGYEASITTNSNSTIKLYKDAMQNGKPFDCVILDLTIPGGPGGKETAEKILSIDPDAKLIISSGYSDNPVISNYKKYGFSGAIIKPYLMDHLKKIIFETLQ